MGWPRHELHDHVRHATIRGPAIEQPRDVAMVEPREDLAFGPEALLGEAAAHVGAHELDGDFGVVLIVVANRLEHIAHTAGAEQSDDAVSADALANAAARGARARQMPASGIRGSPCRGNAPGCSCESSSDCTSAMSAGSPPDSSVRKAARSSAEDRPPRRTAPSPASQCVALKWLRPHRAPRARGAARRAPWPIRA